MVINIKREDLDETSYKALCAILSCPVDSKFIKLNRNKVEYERGKKSNAIHK